MTRLMRTTCMLLLLPLGIGGCDGGANPTTPSVPAAPTAPPRPTGPVSTSALSVTSIDPNVGATGGAARLQVFGAGFRPGVLVRFGEVTVPAKFDHRDAPGAVMYVDAPAHAAGTVDVTITNTDGGRVVLPSGYTFVPPGSLDFNGRWWGYGDSGQDIPILFTIRDDHVVSVSCDEYVTLTFESPPIVRDGSFSYAGNGVVFTGRIVSAMQAVGTINLGPCMATNWGSEKDTTPP